jgi:hypothetical protein
MVNKGLNAPQLHAGAHQPPHTAMMTTSAMIAAAEYAHGHHQPGAGCLIWRCMGSSLSSGDVMLLAGSHPRALPYVADRRGVMFLINAEGMAQSVPGGAELVRDIGKASSNSADAQVEASSNLAIAKPLASERRQLHFSFGQTRGLGDGALSRSLLGAGDPYRVLCAPVSGDALRFVKRRPMGIGKEHRRDLIKACGGTTTLAG